MALKQGYSALSKPISRYSSSLYRGIQLDRPQIETTAFFLCDVQEKFRTHINGFEHVVQTSKKMLRASEILEIPVITTEQNPKALGATVQELQRANAIPKTLFSMHLPEVEERLRSLQTQTVVLFGIESHVCVTQTALDLLRKNIQVSVLADGVSSMNPEEVPIALRRLSIAGCTITTSESILFELLADSNHSKFKQISKLVKDFKEETSSALMNLAPVPSKI